MKNLKNLMALAFIAMAAFVVGCKSDAAKNNTSSETNVSQGHDHDGHDHAGHSHDGHNHDTPIASSETLVNQTANAVNGAKTAVKNAAEGATSFSVNAAGDLVDAKGNLIAKAGSFSFNDGTYLDAEGKEIGVLKKIGSAIGGAATKSADAMKKVFSGLFKSKEKVGSTYLMSKIVFDDESHRITDFSKGEVEGLAAALKDMPDAKIQVQVHGDADKGVTEKRAEVIKAMLVTLGVDKKQISSKGMGADDAAKAKDGKVEIKVEKTVE